MTVSRCAGAADTQTPGRGRARRAVRCKPLRQRSALSTPQAAPRNRRAAPSTAPQHPPLRRSPVACRNMDLYKWSYKKD